MLVGSKADRLTMFTTQGGKNWHKWKQREPECTEEGPQPSWVERGVQKGYGKVPGGSNTSFGF